MRMIVNEIRAGIRNSTTRIPFRYGQSCLSRCPQLVVEAQIHAISATHRGWSGDCLPPGWFDKTPGKSYQQQIAEMLRAFDIARRLMLERCQQPVHLFDAWLETYHETHAQAAAAGIAPLVAGFGMSLVERAVADAMARAAGIGYAQALRTDLYGIAAERVHDRLHSFQPVDWLPPQPSQTILVRHTVGLSDPLTDADLSAGERVEDGLPQTLEQHIASSGIRAFKVKLSNQPERDQDRLERFAAVVEQHRGGDYLLTLDGNEQYTSPDQFLAFAAWLDAQPGFAQLKRNIMAVEQPLERSIALNPAHARGIARMTDWKPVLIDESDDQLDSYSRALELGYRGVSSKACKGPFKSILNAGLVWLYNQATPGQPCFLTGEDLCCVGVVPVQWDLCLVAAMGLTHVERNGHHYHPGLSYLPPADQERALAAHPDLYAMTAGIIGPAVREGRLSLGSLHGPGCGFAVVPDLAEWTPVEQWRFESLGLDSPPTSAAPFEGSGS